MAFLKLKSINLDFPVPGVTGIVRDELAEPTLTGGNLSKRSSKFTIVEALKEVTFDLKDGARVGLIGQNGSGKTTLLKVIAGIYEPTLGSVEREGRVSTLFNIGLGMDEGLSGYENIKLGLMLGGTSSRDMTAKSEEVADFSELGSFLHLPMHTYSAGMKTRLGFSIATSIEPEILLIDEVFGAGDQFFATKASRRLEELLAKAQILIFASHSINLIRKFCDQAIILKKGRIVSSGAIGSVLSTYRKTGGGSANITTSDESEMLLNDSALNSSEEDHNSFRWSFPKLLKVRNQNVADKEYPPVLVFAGIPMVSDKTIRLVLSSNYRNLEIIGSRYDYDQLDFSMLCDLPRQALHGPIPPIALFIEGVEMNPTTLPIDMPHIIISLLRHPIERMLAYFHFHSCVKNSIFNEMIESGGLNELEFSERMLPAMKMQYQYFLDEKEEVSEDWLDIALNNLSARLSFFGIFEEITEFYFSLQQMCGLPNVYYDKSARAEKERQIERRHSLSSTYMARMTDMLERDLVFYEAAKKLCHERNAKISQNAELANNSFTDRSRIFSEVIKKSREENANVHPWTKFYD